MTDLSTSPREPYPEGIAVGCFASLCRDRLADQLLTFSRTVPHTSLGVHEMALAELLPAVRGGRVALAIGPEEPAEDDLATMPLWAEQAVAVMAADHPLAAERRLHPDHLARSVMLLSTDRAEGEMQRFLLARLFPSGLPPVRTLAGRGTDLLARAAAGEGVALLLASHDIPAGLAARPLVAPASRFTVHAVWQKDYRSAPLATLLRLLHGARAVDAGSPV